MSTSQAQKAYLEDQSLPVKRAPVPTAAPSAPRAFGTRPRVHRRLPSPVEPETSVTVSSARRGADGGPSGPSSAATKAAKKPWAMDMRPQGGVPKPTYRRTRPLEMLKESPYLQSIFPKDNYSADDQWWVGQLARTDPQQKYQTELFFFFFFPFNLNFIKIFKALKLLKKKKI